MDPISKIYPKLKDHYIFRKSVLFLYLSILLLLTSCDSGAPDVTQYSIKSEKWYQNEHLLNSAWQNLTASLYKNNFVYQENASFCGPASIVNILGSIGIKDVEQSNVFDNTSIYYIKARILGLTLDEMNTLLKANIKSDRKEWTVTLLRDLTMKQFRQHLFQSNNINQRYIINFNRLPLFGVNIGHHSPLGGFNEGEDLVFVLDVYDKYKPFLVKADLLYKAMNTVDSETGKKRGLISIKRIPQP